ncbi:MAG: transcription termination/antitermination protein NusG, partial [Firmicutes bacterium]|nr:transcription termination/antitermination protein NusG [Bacillota bacterium]
YVYVKMHYLPNMWHMVTNTRGVTGFVGPQGRPMPLTPAEIKTLRIDIAPVFETDIKVGDAVKVMEGALAGYDGIIESVDVPNSKVKVVVSMFGKDTHVDLAMAHVDRVF